MALRSSPSIEHSADRRAYASTGMLYILHGNYDLGFQSGHHV